MAREMVRQAVLPLIPQQEASLPVFPSTLMVPPVLRAEQHTESVWSQKSPATQLVLSLQLVKQALVVLSQMKGEQTVVPGVGQLPFPSQTLGSSSMPLVQLERIVPQAVVAAG